MLAPFFTGVISTDLPYIGQSFDQWNYSGMTQISCVNTARQAGRVSTCTLYLGNSARTTNTQLRSKIISCVSTWAVAQQGNRVYRENLTYTFQRGQGDNEGESRCGTKLAEGTVVSQFTRAYEIMPLGAKTRRLHPSPPSKTLKSKRQGVERLL